MQPVIGFAFMSVYYYAELHVPVPVGCSVYFYMYDGVAYIFTKLYLAYSPAFLPSCVTSLYTLCVS